MKTAFCFDLDGTVTTTEILPCIASELDIAEEMAVLTQATMDGLIDFRASFRLRVRLLATIAPGRVRDIVAQVPLDPHISDFIRRRTDCFVVSGNLAQWISPIIEQLDCGSFASQAGDGEGGLQLEHILDKGAALDCLRQQGFERIVAVGDGMNDCAMFDRADIAIAYGGVHAPVAGLTARADYLVNNGRKLCQLLQML
ncbi:hypothetical protein NFHSH190041_11920 [Shewanella sp. NFH-SH190041]|uniref:HAD-IB family phosphatase n=1 Tax=Shewanella sp. NFH-SH190041 TaxID=2950245 RepID=UPI0021C437B1|nr:HAD-IB family phosphatase [Shewanella sp. NFH-SH190041]BDM63740.1 hypothetical protein NFHSH190041_11920 [Shewanella sp. NFH-SH190041]